MDRYGYWNKILHVDLTDRTWRSRSRATRSSGATAAGAASSRTTC